MKRRRRTDEENKEEGKRNEEVEEEETKGEMKSRSEDRKMKVTMNHIYL